ncbi:uncharacterized protein LOC124622105 isoform X1 [Schistocerca americana]|uniref:uncharacterized protein LOC124622105 isoform X1 n=1 Tax=Schistocerca americana TaxID=7009 RepID=UPI001F5019B1|nr:uncharacterized protein LOC124622105 isoform X1 [Schistocerca americana]XP_049937936.1 uncharacterized protein LOC126412400 isoform X1 [Schistocerca serialis cubense]
MSRQLWKDFLIAYMSMPCLWKVRSPDYNNRVKKNQCYAILANMCREFEPTADRAFVQRKINSFRTTFRKEHRKVTESKMCATGTADVHKPTLWYYDILLPTVLQGSPRSIQSTLEEVELAQDDISNFEDSEADAEASSLLEGEGGHYQEFKQFKDAGNESEATASMRGIADNGVVSSVSAPPALSLRTVLPTVCTKRMWQESKNDELQKVACEQQSSPLMENDEFYHFGMSIALKMRKMSNMNNMQCIIAEKLISEVIFHGHMQDLTYDTVIKIPGKHVN